MKISIIVPIYNVEAYIRECFDSIAAQTYKGELECIFVDDCGQDKSVGILEGLMAGYHGDIDFFLIHHGHNKGLSGARNTGIRNAIGEYLYFLDSDDTITPDCIEKLVALAMKYHGVEVVQGSAKSKLRFLQLGWKKLPEFSNNFKWIKKTILKRDVLAMTAWNKLVKRSFVLSHHLFFKEGVIHEDDLWNFNLAKYTHSIAVCTSETYVYRENPNGIMNVANPPEKYVPILVEMARHITAPYTCSEILSISYICGEHPNDLCYHDYLKYIPYNQRVLRLWAKLNDLVNTSTYKTVKGLLYRLCFKSLTKLIDLSYCKS